MRSANLGIWVLVISGVYLQLVRAIHPDLILLSVGTVVQGIGLWIHCRAKSRSRWWVLLALAPGFGWVGVVYLKSPAQLEALAREKANRRMNRKDSRMSRMAVAAFAAGAAFYLLFLFAIETGIPACRGMSPEVTDRLESILAIALPLSVAALLFGSVANFRIARSHGRLRGRQLAQLAVVLSVMSLLCTMAIPRFFLWREFGAEKLALRTLHRAESGYRSRYPGTGYSPDLRSLGPPPRSVPASVKRAGIVAGPLSEGIYCAGKDRLRYEPHTGDDGTVVAYEIRLNSRLYTRRMDETGTIQFAANSLE